MTWDRIEEKEPEIKAKFTPSQYQTDIFNMLDAIQGNGEHIVVQAVAGSGKSTTGVEIFKRLPKGLDVAFVAFNSSIAKEIGSRLPSGSNARTYHSLGLMTLKQTYQRVEVNQDKVNDFLDVYAKYNKWIIPSSRKLISICKGSLNLPDDFDNERLEKLAFQFDIETYNDDAKHKIFDAVRVGLANSFENPKEVDFDDMIWLPNVLEHVSFCDFDFLFIDEVQDTNFGQLYLAMNSIVENGTICGVGDRKQSIYAWRGASSTAMDQLKKELNAHEMPLSISYRCPVAVRDYVHREFPDIAFEIPDNAKEGKIEHIQMTDKVMETIQPGDMVLCRVNADLVSTAFRMIRSGRKATIQGRDIGKGIVDLIKKAKTDDVTKMLLWIKAWRIAETTKAYALDMDKKVQYITDRADTVSALSEGATTVAEVMDRCYTLFSDGNEGIKLSSIHRAKGMEADNVFILRPDLLPHPAAKKPEDVISEENVRYVAVTRTKDNLTFLMP